jgi:periplasmic protein CpxP/Spy
MSYPFRRAGIALPRTRSMAFAALLSAPLVAAPLALVHAQTTQTPMPGTHAPTAASAEHEAETVEQRVTQLHSQLKITPDEESKWNAVAQAMRDNAANMQKLVAEKRQQAPQNMTAVEDLQTYQDFTQQHLDGLKNLTSAFKTLYDAMPDPQKKNADEVFAKFNREAPNATPNRNG